MGLSMCCHLGDRNPPPPSPTPQISYNPHDLSMEQLHHLILQTLVFLRMRDIYDHLLQLQIYSEVESNWVVLMVEMVKILVQEDPLTPLVIVVVVDQCLVPSKNLSMELYKKLGITKEERNDRQMVEKDEMRKLKIRNECVLLGALAKKMAGSNSVHLLTDDVLHFLFNNIKTYPHDHICLFSLIALEKFAQTGENKLRIMECMKDGSVLEGLEESYGHCENDMTKHQIAFLSQWALDNLFVFESRVFTFTKLKQLNKHGNNNNHLNNNDDIVNNNNDVNNNKKNNSIKNNTNNIKNNNSHNNHHNINGDVRVILNQKDASEYLKLSADGLEARCDVKSFESVRCTLEMSGGRWYYEALIVTPGVMQIGWASKESKFLTEDGFGIGDDTHSIAYDGCRQAVWFDAEPLSNNHACWKPGDILGTMLDTLSMTVTFWLSKYPPTTIPFHTTDTSFFAAASFMTFQQCRFNFGATPFHHHPPPPFNTPNHHGDTCERLNAVVPRPILLKQLADTQIKEDSCVLCVDRKSCVMLFPCLHKDLCKECSDQLTFCPICRGHIVSRVFVS